MKSVTHATAQGARNHQEDHLVVATVPDGQLLAVMDGHGGSEVSSILAQRLVPVWMQMSDGETDGDELIKKVFMSLAMETCFLEAGSTMSLVFIGEQADAVAVAVVGDSPVFVKTAGAFPWIAPEHNARDNEKERAAAEKRGGIYLNGYMWNSKGKFSDLGRGLQMTRAFGDADCEFIIGEPEISVISIQKPAWVLVASDGLIDPTHRNATAEHDAIIDLLNQGAEAKDLVNRAVRLQTNDNATAIVWRNK
jgi:serine/threonine protein phosphatase PrpC